MGAIFLFQKKKITLFKFKTSSVASRNGFSILIYKTCEVQNIHNRQMTHVMISLKKRQNLSVITLASKRWIFHCLGLSVAMAFFYLISPFLVVCVETIFSFLDCPWWTFLADRRNCCLESLLSTTLSLMLEDIRVAHLLLIDTLEPEAGPEEWDYENQVAKPFSFSFLLASCIFPTSRFLTIKWQKTCKL